MGRRIRRDCRAAPKSIHVERVNWSRIRFWKIAGWGFDGRMEEGWEEMSWVVEDMVLFFFLFELEILMRQ